MLKVLETFQRVRILETEDYYIHAEFKSRLFRFIDDVEFLAGEPAGCIQVRSASRVGYWDMGVNRKRIEKIRYKFYQKTEQNAKVL